MSKFKHGQWVELIAEHNQYRPGSRGTIYGESGDIAGVYLGPDDTIAVIFPTKSLKALKTNKLFPLKHRAIPA